MLEKNVPIAIFDSGVGGLSILKEARKLLPSEDFIYFGDQAHVPYGPRKPKEIRELSENAVQFLLSQQAKAIVIACNTASAFALHTLRETHPDVAFVGMEPAVKPAAANTKTGTIGVLMTEATKQGKLYKSVVDRFANGHNVVGVVSPEFVELVEAGILTGPRAEAIVEGSISDALAQGADHLVLGCTHFSFLAPIIQKVAGPDVTIVDPSPAVARQLQRITKDVRNETGGDVQIYTSSMADEPVRVLSELADVPIDAIQRYSLVSSSSASS